MLSDTARIEKLLDLADRRVAQIFSHIWAWLANVVLCIISAAFSPLTVMTYWIPLGSHVWAHELV